MTATDAPPIAPPRPVVDTRLIAPFMESVRSVFRTMANVDIQLQMPFVKTVRSTFDVYGIIGFSGELTGAVTLTFSLASAEKLVEAFSGSPVDRDSPQFADAIGELANMVAGSAKSAMGFKANISVPSVVIGNQCHVSTPSDIPCVVIPCRSPMGSFAVEVCVKQQKKA